MRMFDTISWEEMKTLCRAKSFHATVSLKMVNRGSGGSQRRKQSVLVRLDYLIEMFYAAVS